ncbi:MAG: Vms1/Ankzf1 family peptidyl-tRNA hydrolase [Halobacteriota archaeon]|nr:Vms1/Ankzf1 family peptidyl-tRNA hydrolase [Halobacteriota archaeon]
MLSNLDDINIKELSDIYDSENKDTFITLFLNIDDYDGKFIEKRKKSCISVLKGKKDLLDNFNRTIKMIEGYLVKMGRENDLKGLALFASHKNNFFAAYELMIPFEDLMVVDTSPYIRPLVQLIDEYEAFGLVLLDSHRAKVYVVSSGIIEVEEEMVSDIMNKHKKGGWSQARFQRLREGAIDHFLKEVREDAEKIFSDEDIKRIVIAGSGNAKKKFVDMISAGIKSKVIDVIDVNFNEAEGKLISRAEKKFFEDGKKRSDENIEKLREEILKDGLAVYGPKETLNAVKNGQVDMLLVRKGLKVRGWICEKCQSVGQGIANFCPNCESVTSEVDVIEEIIEFAKRKETEIDFASDNQILAELGGIGGLLRYK